MNLGTADWGFTGFTIGYAVFNRLVQLSDDGTTIEPELVESLPEVSRDGLTYTFRLRDGVTFHDGTVLTAEDVKFTLERAMSNQPPVQAQSLYQPLGITGTAEWVAGEADEVTGLRVVDPLTLEMQLDAPNSAVPYTLSMTMASIVPKAYVEEIGSEAFEQQPIGSGPYRITAYSPGESLTMERYEDYWDQENAGYVDGIDWELNVDPQLATLRIVDGEADFTHDKIPPGQLAEVRENPGYNIGPFNNVFYVATSLEHPRRRTCGCGRRSLTRSTRSGSSGSSEASASPRPAGSSRRSRPTTSRISRTRTTRNERRRFWPKPASRTVSTSSC